MAAAELRSFTAAPAVEVGRAIPAPRRALVRIARGAMPGPGAGVEAEEAGAAAPLDAGVFEEVFPASVERAKRAGAGERRRGVTTPQSTLVPDDWKPVQAYIERGKKERRREALALQDEWARRRAREHRATRDELEGMEEQAPAQVGRDEAAATVERDGDGDGDGAAGEAAEEEEEEDGRVLATAPDSLGGRARPKDYRSELEFSGFEDIARSLREGAGGAEEERGRDGGKDGGKELEKKFSLTAEEKAMLRSKRLDFARISTAKWSSLHTLAAAGQVYLAAELLKRGVDANMVDGEGLTPLHRAVQAGRKTMVRMLLKVGADPRVLDRQGATLLHYAAQNGSEEIGKLLLRHGVDANVRDADGWTALHLAVQSGRLELIKALVYRGADLNSPNKDGNTALDLALAFGGCFNFYDAIKFLKKRSVLDADERLSDDANGVPREPSGVS